MSELVRESAVLLGQGEGTREGMLRLIARRCAELGIATDADAVFEALVEREELGETGMTDGFAIPHAKSPSIRVPAVVVVRNERPIEWPSFDNRPVDTAIALLVPEAGAGDAHVRLLSRVAALLMSDEFRARLRAAADPRSVAQVLGEGIEKGPEAAQA